MPAPSTDPAITSDEIARSGLCVGCGACASAGTGPVMAFDRYGQFKPRGGRAHAVTGICPFSPAASNEDELAARLYGHAPRRDGRIGHFEAAYAGFASEGSFRSDGSSGGLTTWLASELLSRGIVDGVAHVAPGTGRDGALFGYRISRTGSEARARAKSRYFPVELSAVLDEIRTVPGRYAVIGIPCFIKAVRLLQAVDPLLEERIAVTLGLFCGHMKSARFADSLIQQLGCDRAQVRRFDFRSKDASRPANWYRAEAQLDDGAVRGRDWWHLADGDWGAGFFQNSACDFCDDVVAETADVSFGDAWIDPYQADGRGTNVVIVRDPALHALLCDANDRGRIALEPITADVVVRTQAAGFRQRREGLAYRLARRRNGLMPRKRVGAAIPPSLRRRLIYACRQQISRWSHRVFHIGRLIRQPTLYTAWARLGLGAYHALAYSRGPLGRIIERVMGPDKKSEAPARQVPDATAANPGRPKS